jgi:hypothetical protein
MDDLDTVSRELMFCGQGLQLGRITYKEEVGRGGLFAEISGCAFYGFEWSIISAHHVNSNFHIAKVVSKKQIQNKKVQKVANKKSRFQSLTVNLVIDPEPEFYNLSTPGVNYYILRGAFSATTFPL